MTLSALEGIRVLDLTTVGMGPYCTMFLGDMGADVIKVEGPEGDIVRYVGPGRHVGMAGMFMQFNRNKRSIVINLRDPAGWDTLKRLVTRSDVFIHSMRARTAKRLALTYDDLRALNETLIYCSVYGYGEAGPYSEKPAYDDLIQAASGLASLQSFENEQPRYVGTIMADKTVALFALSAVLSALFHRERSGKGQRIEVPMFETMSAFVLVEHMYGRVFVPAMGPTRYPRLTTPHRRPYQTADGFVSVMPYNDSQWSRMFNAIGQAELLADPRFVNMTSRTDNIDLLYGMVAKAMLSRSTAEWLEILGAADIPAMPVNSIEQVLDDPHLDAVGLFPVVEHPTEGTIRMIANPITWTETPARYRRPAPRLGEHSREVLAEAGFTQDEVDQLIVNGAVIASEPAG